MKVVTQIIYQLNYFKIINQLQILSYHLVDLILLVKSKKLVLILINEIKKYNRILSLKLIMVHSSMNKEFVLLIIYQHKI